MGCSELLAVVSLLRGSFRPPRRFQDGRMSQVDSKNMSTKAREFSHSANPWLAESALHAILSKSLELVSPLYPADRPRRSENHRLTVADTGQ